MRFSVLNAAAHTSGGIATAVRRKGVMFGMHVRNARVVAGYVILLPKVTLTGKSWHRSLTPFLIVFNISWGLREIIAEGDTEGL